MRYSLSISILALASAGLGAQVHCHDTGSRLTRGSWDAGPPLACRFRASAPAWRLFTPPHRVPVPRRGYNPGRAWEIPRLLIRYRCTGRWLVPVVVAEVKFLGYVFDVGQVECEPLDAR